MIEPPRPRPAPRPPSALDAIELVQQASLDRIQGDGTDRALLVRLLETSSLLELSKLGTARLDLATYLQLAVDVVATFFPVEGASCDLWADGLPHLSVWSGSAVDDTNADQSFPVVVADQHVGVLRVGRMTADLGPTTFFTAAADEVSSGVAAIGEAEVLRRRAALANARNAAMGLDDDTYEAGFSAVADALAAWPGALAGEVRVDLDVLGPPITVRAGYWDNDGRDRPVLDLESGPVTLRVRWASAAEEGASGPIEEIAAAMITALARVERTLRLQEESETDPLTCLGNRRRLTRALAAALSRAGRYGERVSLLLADLDHFKAVNDTLGHDVGDEVLRVCAHALTSSVRGYDEVVRFGGEEFVVLSPACDIVGAMSLAERVRERVRRECRAVLPPDWDQTVSIGVSVFPDSGSSPDELLKRADEAMYMAKASGRDTIRVALPYDLSEPDVAAVVHLPADDESDEPGPGPDPGEGAGRLRTLARRLMRT